MDDISRDTTSQTPTVATTNTSPDRAERISRYRDFRHTVVVTGEPERLRAFLDRVRGEEAVYEDDLYYLDDENEPDEEDSDGDEELDDEQTDGGNPDLLIPFCFHAILPLPDDVLQTYSRQGGEEWAAGYWGCPDEADHLSVGWNGDAAVMVTFEAGGVVTPVLDALAGEFPDLAFALVAESVGGAVDVRVEVEWSGGGRVRQATTVPPTPPAEGPLPRADTAARLIAAARDGRLEYVADRLLVSGPGVAAAVLAGIPDELRGLLSRLTARLDGARERLAAELREEARRLGLSDFAVYRRLHGIDIGFDADRSTREMIRDELDRGADPDELREALRGKYD